MASQSSSGISSSGRPTCPQTPPALCTSMSNGPCSRTSAWMSRLLGEVARRRRVMRPRDPRASVGEFGGRGCRRPRPRAPSRASASGDAAADAVRRAGHERLPAGEIEIHVSLHLPRVDAVSTIADALDLRKQDALDRVWIGHVPVFDGQDALMAAVERRLPRPWRRRSRRPATRKAGRPGHPPARSR